MSGILIILFLSAENAIKSLVGKDLIRLIPPIPNKSYGIAKITEYVLPNSKHRHRLKFSDFL